MELYENQHPLWNAREWPFFRSFSLPLWNLKSQLQQLDDFQKNMYVGKDGFDVKLDVGDFEPDEIKVKTIDNSIVIEAKHEEKKDEVGSISRHIVRRYNLPKGFKVEEVASSLSSDGILTIKCPKAISNEGALVREIKIEPTGPARLTDQSKQVETKIEAAEGKTEGKA